MKKLSLPIFNNVEITLEAPSNLILKNITNINDQIFLDFLIKNYQLLYDCFDEKKENSFQISFDDLNHELITFDFDAKIKKAINLEKPDLKFSPKNKRDLLLLLISYFPQFALLIKNFHLSAYTSIMVAELILKEKIDVTNFVQAKKYIDIINKIKWDRPQTDNEKQSGVSNLGSVSEKLLEKAFDTLIDGTNLFKTTSQEIQSYGDFVLMCLPNNLWISVKSNFARERLLASGYTTDILGVGFFTDSKEFTSYSKVRNFQRVGFLAMYLPDIALTEMQDANTTSTYDEVIHKFKELGKALPKNINGTDFYRPLSQIYKDLQQLLAQSDISKRTTISF